MRPLLTALCCVVPALALAQTPGPPARQLTLAEAVGQAVDSAPAVLVAALRQAEADERVRQVRAPLRPVVAATAGWQNRTFNPEQIGISVPPGSGLAPDGLIGPFDNWDARLRATQALFDRATGLRTGAAREQALGVSAEREGTEEAVAERAALTYLAVQRARALMQARVTDSSLAVELLDLARAQVEAGVSAPIDTVRARTRLAASAGAVIVARSELDRARIALGRALGLGPAARVDAGDTLAATTAVLPVAGGRAALVEAAGSRRPEIAAERAQARAAGRAETAIGAERWPRIELAGDVGLNGPALGDLLVTRQIGVQVTVPLVDGFSLEARRGQESARRAAAEIRLADLEWQIAADVDGALLSLRAAEAQQAIAGEGLALAAEELRQARERFAAGVAGSIELIEAQRSLVGARDAVIEALAGAAAARVALARAAGVARDLR